MESAEKGTISMLANVIRRLFNEVKEGTRAILA
jgi:hypothetical protein